jgi:hypothetical protein
MANSSKKLIIIGGFIFVIITGIFLVLQFLKKEEIIKPVKETTIERSTEIPNYVTGKLPVKIEEEKTEFSIPVNEAPLLDYTLKGIDKNFAESVAASLGYQGQSQEITDVLEGIKYVWYDPESYLWITPSKAQIRYGQNKFSNVDVDKGFSDEELSNIAVNFIQNNIKVDEDIEVTSVDYLKQAKVKEAGFIDTNRDEAVLFQVNITYSGIDSPILTTSPTHPTVFVQIKRNGEVYKAEAYLFSSHSFSDKKYTLKSKEDILNSLDEAKLMGVKNVYLNLNDLRASRIEEINIEKVHLAYFFNDSTLDTPLQPVFMLEGPIIIKNTTADYARLYMPALKTN